VISPDLTTVWYVQQSDDVRVLGHGWRDVPVDTFRRRCGPGVPTNPFDDINHAQAAMDELAAHSNDFAEFRIVGRPVLTKE
jgi:hypothetical protein